MDKEETDLILLLATSSASLDRSPKKNWVENAGNLPPYIRKLARAIEKTGKPLSSAIAIAISRVKKWAAGGGGVDADTKAKAAKALAQWEALKAKNKAKKVIKATRHDGTEYILLSNVSSFNTDIVRSAWNARESEARRDARAKNPTLDPYELAPYTYIKELWTDHILVEVENNEGPKIVKVDYEVSDSNEVTFGEPVRMQNLWVEMDDEDLDAEERELLSDMFKLSGDSIANLKMIGQVL